MKIVLEKKNYFIKIVSLCLLCLCSSSCTIPKRLYKVEMIEVKGTVKDQSGTPKGDLKIELSNGVNIISQNDGRFSWLGHTKAEPLIVFDLSGEKLESSIQHDKIDNHWEIVVSIPHQNKYEPTYREDNQSVRQTPQITVPKKRIEPIKGYVYCSENDFSYPLNDFSLCINPDAIELKTDHTGHFDCNKIECNNISIPPERISFSCLYNSHKEHMVLSKKSYSKGELHLYMQKKVKINIVNQQKNQKELDNAQLIIKSRNITLFFINGVLQNQTEYLYESLFDKDNLEVWQNNKKLNILRVAKRNNDCYLRVSVFVEPYKYIPVPSPVIPIQTSEIPKQSPDIPRPPPDIPIPSPDFPIPPPDSPTIPSHTVEGWIYRDYPRNPRIPVSNVKIYYDESKYVVSAKDGSFSFSYSHVFIIKLIYKGKKYELKDQQFEYDKINERLTLYLPIERQNISFIVKYANKNHSVVPNARIKIEPPDGIYIRTNDKGEYHWQGVSDTLPKPTKVWIDGILRRNFDLSFNEDAHIYTITVRDKDTITVRDKDICEQIKINNTAKTDNHHDNRNIIILKNTEEIYGYNFEKENTGWNMSYGEFKKSKILPKYIHTDETSKYFCILHKNKKRIQLRNKFNGEERSSITLPFKTNHHSIVYNEIRANVRSEPESIIGFAFEKDSKISIISIHDHNCKIFNMPDSKEKICSNIAIYKNDYAFVSTRLNGQPVIHRININDDTTQNYNMDVLIQKIIIQNEVKKLILVTERGNVLVTNFELEIENKKVTKYGMIEDSIFVFKDCGGQYYWGGLFPQIYNESPVPNVYKWNIYSMSCSRSFWTSNDSINMEINQYIPYFSGAIPTNNKVYTFFIQGKKLFSFSKNVKRNSNGVQGVGQWTKKEIALTNEATGLTIYPSRKENGGWVVVKMIEMKHSLFSQVFIVNNKGLDKLSITY